MRKKKRICRRCGAALSIYNKTKECWVHSEESYVMHIPITKCTSYEPGTELGSDVMFSKVRVFKVDGSENHHTYYRSGGSVNEEKLNG